MSRQHDTLTRVTKNVTHAILATDAIHELQLDENLNAKIGDFGLSRFVSENGKMTVAVVSSAVTAHSTRGVLIIMN